MKLEIVIDNVTFDLPKTESMDLVDRRGVPYYSYPKNHRSNISINGVCFWTGTPWTKEKVDGLIPFLNEKLKEYFS